MMVNWPIWMESGFCGDVRILKCRGEAVVGGRERGRGVLHHHPTLALDLD